jgi:hypothetical protein
VQLFVLALLALIGVTVDAATFTEVVPSGISWSAREKANVEYVKRQTQFRDGESSARVTLTNYFLLYGGQTSQGGQNDVWASSNGRAWYFVAGVSDGFEHPVYPDTFPPWNEIAHCQDSQYRQYRAGGQRDGQIYNDVWSSVDGVIWREMASAAEFDPVYLANMVADSNDRLYIAGGILELNANPRLSSGTVWTSVNQGRTWRQVYQGTDANGIPTGPGARAVSILLNSDNNLIWLTGVNTGFSTGDRPESYYKDVWVSTSLGRTWEPVNLNTPFGRRDDANAEITANGIMVLAGGYSGTGQGLSQQGEIYNDVWVSANGGYSWGLCVADAEWDDRRYQMTLLDGDGYLWVMGGTGSNGYQYADIWKSVWNYNDLASVTQRCRITIPDCGAGLKCLPNQGNTLVATDGSGVYCDACPYKFASQAAAQNLLVGFLIVFVILFLLAVAALGYTYYKLRNAGVTSPIPLPASAQRWWSKTGPTAAGSTDGGATANGDGLYQPLRIRDQV